MRFQPLIGAAQLAIGKGEGIVRFGDSPQAFLASLAPLLAIPIVGALALLVSGRVVAAVLVLLMSLLLQLGPAVVSHWIAVRWAREEYWLRYATAYNWCQWALPVAALVLLIAIQMFGGPSLTVDQASSLLVLLLGLYGMWLNWIVARYGLDLSRWRAAGFVVMSNIGVGVLLYVPQVIRAIIE